MNAALSVPSGAADDAAGGAPQPAALKLAAPERLQPQPLDHRFTATLLAEAGSGAWTCVLMPDSVAFFGTGRAVRVAGTVDGAPLASSFMPTGDGTHMLPVKAAILKAIGKSAGDEVTVHLQQRLS